MEKSIETIWKEGFLEDNKLIAPKLNNLYNQKSKYLVDKLKRTFRINLIALVITAIVFLVVHYFLDAIWQGMVAAAFLLVLAWYSQYQMREINTLDQGKSSYQYLKSLDQWLKDAMAKNVIIMRFFYPVCFLTAMSTMWFAGDNKSVLADSLSETFPDLKLVGGVPLIGLVVIGIVTLLIAYFSDKIYMWDVRLMYGRIFKKLEDTIADMEELRS